MSATPSPDAVDHLARDFDQALDVLRQAPAFARPRYQPEVQRLAAGLLDSEPGVDALVARAGAFQEAGVFDGGPWKNPEGLVPRLVRGCLEGGGVYPIMECLSELRLLDLARHAEGADQEVARAFLEEALALNLDLLLPGATEESRAQATNRARARRVLERVLDLLSPPALLARVTDEATALAVQRRISTRALVRATRIGLRLAEAQQLEAPALTRFQRALDGPSPLSQAHRAPAAYRRELVVADPATVAGEAQALGESLRATGLACRQHAVLLRRLRKHPPELTAAALGLSEVGAAYLERDLELIRGLVSASIFPGTAQALYGLAQALERGILGRPEVSAGLRRLAELALCPRAREVLAGARPRPPDPQARLVAGALQVLGQPLGVSQGDHPTCQAARALSIWSQRFPGYLLEVLVTAARDDLVEMRFEGETLISSQLPPASLIEVESSLDPVSRVLVPHLDRLYQEMMRRVAARPEDGHRWVNPAMYTRSVPTGFASVFDKATGQVVDHPDFVRRFYATHHPLYDDDGGALAYPNPVGLCVTTSRGELLGLHAVTLQRVAEDPEGVLRVYFYNPNEEGRQNWGGGVTPSTQGCGELEGESSLPFEQFTSRLYAFHFNPYEQGDAFAVPQEVIEDVTRMARTTWGRRYVWR